MYLRKYNYLLPTGIILGRKVHKWYSHHDVWKSESLYYAIYCKYVIKCLSVRVNNNSSSNTYNDICVLLYISYVYI